MSANAKTTGKNASTKRFSENGHPPETPPDVVPKPPEAEKVTITPPRFKVIELNLRGIAPLCILRFSEKAQNQMRGTQEAGQQAKSKKVREPKDFAKNYEEAKYIGADKDGAKWCGINASSFRNAAIGMCRLVGYKMTLAKLSIFVIADGYDVYNNTPLVKIISKSGPKMTITPMRNANSSMDLRARPQWDEWEVKLRVRFDEDQFSLTDIVNLFMRVGLQGGVGEGRPNSRDSNGAGMGMFELVM